VHVRIEPDGGREVRQSAKTPSFPARSAVPWRVLRPARAPAASQAVPRLSLSVLRSIPVVLDASGYGDLDDDVHDGDYAMTTSWFLAPMPPRRHTPQATLSLLTAQRHWVMASSGS